MSSLASNLSRLRGALEMLFVGWFPFTTLRVKPVDLTGRNALVSGANVGIGYEVALKLAQFGANVWLLCRDRVKAEAAREKIVEETGNQNITIAVVDFSSLASVQHFADEWEMSKKPIDILINNAGGLVHNFMKTDDGYEINYQTNLLSHVLLVLKLLPRFADRARIVNVSSFGQYGAKGELLKPEDVDLARFIEKELGVHEGDPFPLGWSLHLYEVNKAFQVIFGRQLQQRLSASPVYAEKHIVIHSCHPGLVKSTIWVRGSNLLPEVEKRRSQLAWVAYTFGVSCEQGACTPVFLATAPETAAGGGGYWDRMTKRTPNVLVLDDTLGDALWDSWVSTSRFEGLAEDLQKRG